MTKRYAGSPLQFAIRAIALELRMDEYAGRPNIPDYVSVKEAAKMLGISDKRVYEYVDAGRLSSVWAADVIMIPLDEVKKFKRRSAGRPRKNIPLWRMSTGANTQFKTSIVVQVRPGKQCLWMEKLEETREKGEHVFPGTVARFIMESETNPGWVEIELVYRCAVMPNEEETEQALEAFRQALDSVLDWSTAHTTSGKILMHT